MARVKHTGPGGTFLGMSRYPKPEPQPKPDFETDNFTEEDAARAGAVLYNLYVMCVFASRPRLDYLV